MRSIWFTICDNYRKEQPYPSASRSNKIRSCVICAIRFGGLSDLITTERHRAALAAATDDSRASRNDDGRVVVGTGGSRQRRSSGAVDRDRSRVAKRAEEVPRDAHRRGGFRMPWSLCDTLCISNRTRAKPCTRHRRSETFGAGSD